MGQTEQSLKKYENLGYGISFFYPQEWGKEMDQCSSTTDFACGPAFFFSSNGTIDPEESRQLHDSYFINARVIQLNKSGDNSAECKCSDLKGFVAWDYTSRNNDRWTFINDNQTVIGNNYSAWQTEMLVGGLGKRYLFAHP